MKLAIAGDVAGEPLALTLYDYLKDRDGLDVTEMSHPDDGSSEYYADMVNRVCRGVIDGRYDRAIIICGTGIGVSMTANKVPGIRAAHVHDTYSAAKASTSNNAQVITMGARVVAGELAKTIADAWLATEFDENGPSADNVAAINAVDASYNKL